MATTPLRSVPITAAGGRIVYNGFTFPVLRQCNMEADPEYDEGGRAIIGWNWTITVKFIVYGADVSSQQTNMDDMQARLSKPGGVLIIENVGFAGKIETNNTGTRPDIKYGPKPKTLRARSIGGFIAYEVIWSAEFFISYCATGSSLPTSGFLSSFSYRVAYGIDREGLTTRTISGKATIVGRRRTIVTGLPGEEAYTTDNLLLDHPDQVRELIIAPVPPEFERTSQVWESEADGVTENFTIVDTELGKYANPVGIVDCNMFLDLENGPGPGFLNWSATLAGNMTVAPGYAPAWAYVKFFTLLGHYASKFQEAAKATEKGVAIPVKLRLRRNIQGRTLEAACTWLVTGCLEDMVKQGGFYDIPEEIGNWQAWSQSMGSSQMNRRGFAQMRHVSNNDKLVSLCNDFGPQTINDSTIYSRPSQEIEFDLCPEIDEKNSYLAFRNKITAVNKQNATVHRIIAGFQGSPEAPTMFSGQTKVVIDGEYSGTNPDTRRTEYHTYPDQYIVMQGDALRMKYVPEIPRIKEIGGRKVEKVAWKIETGVVTTVLCEEVIGARWIVVYRVIGPPMSFVEPMKNVNMCFGAGTDDGRES